MLWGSPALPVWAVASDAASTIRKRSHALGQIRLCQSKIETGHCLSINPVAPPSPTEDSVPCLLPPGTPARPGHERTRPYTCKQTYAAEGLEQLLLLNIWTYTYKLLNTLVQNYRVFHILSLKNHLSAHSFQTAVSPVCQSGTQPYKNMNNSSPSLLSHADGCSSSDGGSNFGGSGNSSVYPTAMGSQRSFAEFNHRQQLTGARVSPHSPG